MRFTTRNGQRVQVGEVFDAWTSGDLNRMIAALPLDAHPIDRHYLMLQICEQAYKLSWKPEMAALFESTMKRHMDEIPAIGPLLSADVGHMPSIPTFRKYVTYLEDEGRIEEAIRVCEFAMLHGIPDTAKTGFKKRAERLRSQA